MASFSRYAPSFPPLLFEYLSRFNPSLTNFFFDRRRQLDPFVEPLLRYSSKDLHWPHFLDSLPLVLGRIDSSPLRFSRRNRSSLGRTLSSAGTRRKYGVGRRQESSKSECDQWEEGSDEGFEKFECREGERSLVCFTLFSSVFLSHRFSS